VKFDEAFKNDGYVKTVEDLAEEVFLVKTTKDKLKFN
jgi:hypothetical protein